MNQNIDASGRVAGKGGNDEQKGLSMQNKHPKEAGQLVAEKPAVWYETKRTRALRVTTSISIIVIASLFTLYTVFYVVASLTGSRQLDEFKDELDEFNEEISIFNDQIGGFQNELDEFTCELGRFNDSSLLDNLFSGEPSDECQS